MSLRQYNCVTCNLDFRRTDFRARWLHCSLGPTLANTISRCCLSCKATSFFCSSRESRGSGVLTEVLFANGGQQTQLNPKFISSRPKSAENLDSSQIEESPFTMLVHRCAAFCSF